MHISGVGGPADKDWMNLTPRNNVDHCFFSKDKSKMQLVLLVSFLSLQLRI